jgi:hypothetical protein
MSRDTKAGRSRAIILLVGGMVPVLLASGPASGADWGDPQVLAEDYGVGSVVLDTSRDGTTTAVYVVDGPDGENVVLLRHIAPDGQMTAPIRVSGPLGSAVWLDARVDDAGNAVVVWDRFYGESVIQARRVSSDGELGPIVDISAQGEQPLLPQVEVAPDGTATFIYRLVNTLVLRQLSVDDVLSEPIPLQYSDASQLRVSRSGHVAFALHAYFPTRETAVARISPDGVLKTRLIARDLPGDDGPASVDVDRDGNVRVVVTNGERDRAWVRAWRLGGRITAARRIVPRRYSAEEVMLRTDLEGRSIVLWADESDSGGGYQLFGRTWRNGTVGSIELVGGARGSYGVSWTCEFDETGAGIVTWLFGSGGGTDLGSRWIRRDGSFAPITHTTAGNNSVALALSPDGVARLAAFDAYALQARLLVWTRPS